MAAMDRSPVAVKGQVTGPITFCTGIADEQRRAIFYNEQVRDAAVLIASGVKLDGKRLILGVSVSLGEQELHWRDFLHSLVERGLNGVELIISDAHVGLQAARKAVFSGIPWQRCQFHVMQNAMRYIPSDAMQEEVVADLRDVFDAPDRAEADRRVGGVGHSLVAEQHVERRIDRVEHVTDDASNDGAADDQRQHQPALATTMTTTLAATSGAATRPAS